jgi:phospholipase C
MPFKVKHVFVLMLENRSYDHMLGYSPIEGPDAETGQHTAANRLSESETNTFAGTTYNVSHDAGYIVPADPNHEFPDVLTQLSGEGATYPAGGPYPAITNSGYAASYGSTFGQAKAGDAMKCYGPDQLPVLNALAREFALCDNWHASVPGPTWPNRMFVHAASSAGLDHSPSTLEIVQWETVAGLSFKNGTIFDRLNQKGIARRLYAGDDFPLVSSLKGIGLGDIRHYDLFAGDLSQPQYPFSYVFIEPSYDVFRNYRAGNSQHPLGDVRLGEALIKSTYEAIRNSPHWAESMLIVTWDEPGGFFDHAIPPRAVPPGDTSPDSPHNQFGFAFDQYGPRVPAVVISPLIPKNQIDHRVYDHASIPATVETLFGLNAMTERDRNANRLTALLTLDAARTDTPETLPGAVTQAVGAVEAAVSRAVKPDPVDPEGSADKGNLPSILNAAMQQHLKVAQQERAAILDRVARIHTRKDAREYLLEVHQMTRAAKAGF